VNAALKNISKHKTGLWWKIPLALLLMLLLLLVISLFILGLNLNSIAHTQVNQALNTFLVAGGTLNELDLQPTNGQVTLSDLTINTPEAFGDKPLLKLNSLHLNLNVGTLFNDPIVVEELSLKGVELTFLRNAQGQLSIFSLLPPDDSTTETTDIKSKPSKEQESLSLPSIQINSILFEKV
jgi:uncharacterized protein involved in outer membrane biogenesis